MTTDAPIAGLFAACACEDPERAYGLFVAALRLFSEASPRLSNDERGSALREIGKASVIVGNGLLELVADASREDEARRVLAMLADAADVAARCIGDGLARVDERGEAVDEMDLARFRHWRAVHARASSSSPAPNAS